MRSCSGGEKVLKKLVSLIYIFQLSSGKNYYTINTDHNHYWQFFLNFSVRSISFWHEPIYVTHLWYAYIVRIYTFYYVKAKIFFLVMYYYLYLAFALLRNSILRNAKFCILTCDENRSKHSRMCLKQESWNHFQGFRIQIHRLHGLVTKPFCLKINFKLRIKPKYCNFDYPTGQ